MSELGSNKGLVSVLIPVYNVANYLHTALDSLQQQTYSNFEVILVNDGSTDASPQICAEYVERDSRFQLVHQRNQGFGAARNTGMLYAKGEFIYFMDSDDLLEPTLLADVMSTFKDNNYDTVFFGFRKVYQKSNKVFDMVPPLLICKEREQASEGILKMLYKGLGFGVWQQVFRTSFLREANVKFPTLKREADIAFLLELYPFLRSFATIPKVYYHYQAYYSAHKNNPDILLNHLILYQLLEKLVEHSNVKLLGDNILYRYFILWFCHVIPLHIILNNNSTLSTRWKAFKELHETPGFKMRLMKWRHFSNGSPLQRLVLFIFGLRSTTLTYALTWLNYSLKFRLKLNYKKIYYNKL